MTDHKTSRFARLLTSTALAAGSGLFFAAATLHPALAGTLPDHAHVAAKASAEGGPGKPSEADRTIRIAASEMAFDLEGIRVRPGETIRFVVTNIGEIPHEFVIADRKEHEAQSAEMTEMPEMAHEEPNVIMVEPGESRELVWHFGRDADLEFACDIPGHAESGMIGKFRNQM